MHSGVLYFDTGIQVPEAMIIINNNKYFHNSYLVFFSEGFHKIPAHHLEF